jgi:hypothetical protein
MPFTLRPFRRVYVRRLLLFLLTTVSISTSIVLVADFDECASAARRLSDTADVDHRPATGVLRVHPTNPRWLTNDSGKAIYLTGISGGMNETFYGTKTYPRASFGCFQDIVSSTTPSINDYATAFDTLISTGLNFVRCWNWENTTFGSQAHYDAGTAVRIPLDQLPYALTDTRVDVTTGHNVTVGIYDLSRFNQAYFDRIRTRVLAAHTRGIVPAVMLFVHDDATTPFSAIGHPYYTGNNVNGVNADTNMDGRVDEAHTLAKGVAGANITAFQDAYIMKMIDTLNDIDGFIWEIANEGNAATLAWQNHIANVVAAYERTGGRQTHLIMMSPYGAPNANLLMNTHVQLVAGSCDTPGIYITNPPASDGSKVLFFDTDHSSTGCGSADIAWPWKSFTRAIHPIALDGREDTATRIAIKAAMAQTLRYANRMNLKAMVPETGTTIFSSGYGLSEACSEYLMFQPSAATDRIDLTDCAGQSFSVEYLDPATGAVTTDTDVNGGESCQFTAGAMRVVYLKRRPSM